MIGEDLFDSLGGGKVTMRGLSLLLDIPQEQIEAAIRVQSPGGDEPFRVTLPREWQQRGFRRRQECAAALGHEPTLFEALKYWAARTDS